VTSLRVIVSLVAAGLILVPISAWAQVQSVDRYVLPRIDMEKIRADDEARVERGEVPHYAAAREVRITPWSHGDWQPTGEDEARWRLRLSSPGAKSLNLAFGRFRMPPGGKLTIATPDGRHRIGPFTEDDNDAHGQLWTPPLAASELVLNLRMPVDRLEELELELTKIHHGYAGFGAPPPKSGDCHVDVACTEAEPWSDQTRSVGLVSIAGVRFCTGFLINNTALDSRPLFLIAEHCGLEAADAPSVVVMWNHQRTVCDGPQAPENERFQTGAVLRASHRPTDTVLLELDDPPDPEAGVYFAGWDRRATAPGRVAAIHHPNTDVKRISFADGAVPTWHLMRSPVAAGNHLRVGQWDLGTTEGGSSGAPLFNQDRRVVGLLHGGYAACGNRRADWFGRLSVAWDGDGRPGSRLSDWLDPIASGASTLDGLDDDASAQ
jgi:hypothetical protein